ncbi:MAG: hypothetical protein U0228_14465 [Myxococcaceae bacterium]
MALENELLKLCGADPRRESEEVEGGEWSPMPFGRPRPLLHELDEESLLERSVRSVALTEPQSTAAANDDGLPDEPLEFLWHAA